MQSSLVTDALKMASFRRYPAGRPINTPIVKGVSANGKSVGSNEGGQAVLAEVCYLQAGD